MDNNFGNDMINKMIGSALGNMTMENSIISTPTIKSNELKIECHTAFGPNTLIYVDKHIITMTQMDIGYSNSILSKTIGIDPTTQYMKECGVVEIPKKIFIDYTVDLVIEDTFAVECAPNSLILKEDGYFPVYLLNDGDNIQITRKNVETGEEFVNNGVLTKIDKSRMLNPIQTPVYVLLSEFENIFIPYISDKTPNMVNFINFKQ